MRYRWRWLPRRNLVTLVQGTLLLAAGALIFWWLTGHPLRSSPYIDPADAIRDNGQFEAELGNRNAQLEEQLRHQDKDQPKAGKKYSFWNFDTSHKIDWHDQSLIQADMKRKGPGEHGRAFRRALDKPKSKVEDSLYNSNGFNAWVSDQIAIDRSVPDIRHPGCQSQLYASELPTVSVVIPFLNEHWSTLLRTFHSVLNRSPEHLIKEIILVDDASNKEHCKAKLDEYIRDYGGAVTQKVRVVRLPEREGLIGARQKGAKEASGEVIIFLDSHVEANVNWLPPLLDPIAEDYKTVVCPFIDVIDMDTFEYRAQDEGKRGAFDWELYYKRLDLLPSDLEHPTRPFKSPVMAGGLFAVSSRWFWEMGGYDTGLKVWGGEQYELSFKIWMCGGQMVDAPCSRVGHIYRKFMPFTAAGFSNYLGKNYVRVAEVWMDEYKEYVYKRRPSYRNLNPGDLTEQKAIRKKLKCKTFKWFMEEIAFDLPKKYPPVEPEPYAHGAIRNDAHSELCCVFKSASERFGLAACSQDDPNQKFMMNWHKDLKMKGPIARDMCADVSAGGNSAPVMPYKCHGQGGNQMWRYDKDTKQLYHGGQKGRCLDMEASSKELFVSSCNASKMSQKWTFEHTNESRLSNWEQVP